jgi:hypothetical protein
VFVLAVYLLLCLLCFLLCYMFATAAAPLAVSRRQFWEYVLPGLSAMGYIACTGKNL